MPRRRDADRDPDDVLPDAVDRALAQDAAVVLLRERPDLGPHEHVAAVLRF